MECIESSNLGLPVHGNEQNEDFFVDEFLDFSNKDGFVDEVEEEEQEEEAEDELEKKVSASISREKIELSSEISNQSSSFSSMDDFGSVPTSELHVPADELEDLEWLSNLVEDSIPEYSPPFPAVVLTEKPPRNTETQTEPLTVTLLVQPCFKTPVGVKPRSKRTRTAGRVWSLSSPSSFTESSSNSTTASSSSASSSPTSTSPLFTQSFDHVDVVGSFSQAKKKKKAADSDEAGNGLGGAQPQAPRRCSHCGVQKTPQWRSGPLGAKTLCNACGVRFKSGRLFPEYRPACSPTFSSLLHSNHHRKVVEMRRKKEVLESSPGSGFLPHPVVPTF